MATADFLDRYLEPVAECFTPQVAQKLVDLRLDEEVRVRIEELGKKSNEGTLTEIEAAEYKDYIEAGDLVALLQAKARRVLNESAD
jgi:hypothetical protein